LYGTSSRRRAEGQHGGWSEKLAEDMETPRAKELLEKSA
jgi:hypothetical protein